MEHSLYLQNSQLQVRVNRIGAELSSFFHKKTSTEHLWHADPHFWGRHAPILFPFVGETVGRVVQYDQMSAPMQRHGFARVKAFEVENHSSGSCTLMLRHDEQTLAIYPFEFELRVTYSLNDGLELTQTMEVLNIGKKELGFQIGGHPAFAVPFEPGHQLAEYQIDLGCEGPIHRHLLTAEGIYSGMTRPVNLMNGAIQLSNDLFLEDALVFKHEDLHEAWLHRAGSDRGVKVRFDGHPMLGVWSVPGAPFVCIEPWHGCADSAISSGRLWDKDGLIRLMPGSKFSTSFTIEITE